MTVLALLLTPLFLFPQRTAPGNVKNANGSPIPHASVYLVNGKEKAIAQTVLSDSLGRFNMPIAGNSQYFIFASYLHHRSDTVAVTRPDSLYTLTIKITETLLQEVTVASVTPIVQKLADRFVFTPGKALSAGATALEVLKFAPLVQYDEKTALFSIINKPGTVVYINNRKSSLPGEMIMAMLRSTPAANIRSIEIITNPGSEYPANAAGGVININFSKMFNEGWSGNLVAGSDQSRFNTTMLNGAVNYRKGKTGIRVSPFLNNSFNYSTKESRIVKSAGQEHISSASHRRYRVAGGGLGLDYDIGKNDLLSFNGFYSTVNGKSSSTSKTASPGSLYFSPVAGKDRYTYNFGNVYYQHAFDSMGKRTFTLNIDYNQFYQGNKTDGRFTAMNAGEIARYRNDLPQQFFNLSQRADYSVQLKNKSKINAGVQFSNTRLAHHLAYYNWDYGSSKFLLNQQLTNNYKYRETYVAAYASFSGSFLEKINGVLGLRAEQINYSSESAKDGIRSDTNYLGLFPHLSLSYVISKQSNISISLSKKISRPNIRQLFPGRTYLNQDYIQENNPFLQPVNTYNSEIMYALQNKYYFSAGHTIHKNQFSQFIIPLIENNTTLLKKTYLNYGNANNTYFSFFSQQYLVKKIWNASLSANVNYTRYISRHTGRLANLHYNLVWNNTLHISGKGNWLAFALFKYYSAFKNMACQRENALFSADAGIRKTISNFSATLYLADIFNTNGKSLMRYHPNPAYAYHYQEERYYTRTVSLSLRYAFGNNQLKLNKNKNAANEEMRSRIGK